MPGYRKTKNVDAGKMAHPKPMKGMKSEHMEESAEKKGMGRMAKLMSGLKKLHGRSKK